MTTLLLARHGETDWNRERPLAGLRRPAAQRDGPRAGARRSRDQLRETPFDAVYSSDLLRAHETAEIVAAPLGVPAVEVDRGLREVDVGDWSGPAHHELEGIDPEGFRRWQDGGKGWNGGESYEQMGERVVAAVVRIAERASGRDDF